mgnify:CR=1 FL=1
MWPLRPLPRSHAAKTARAARMTAATAGRMIGAATIGPVKIGCVKIGRATTVPVKIGHVKIVAPTATAVIGSVIAVIAGRNGWSSRGIRIQLMHRRSMTANRFCRRCHPPSRAARAVA